MIAVGRHRLDFQSYCRIKAVNASSLMNFKKSPKHYQHSLTRERIDSDALRIGRACHTATLEPDQFLREYVLWSGGRRYGKEWDYFRESAEGRNQTVLREQDYNLALKVRDSVRGHEAAMRYLSHKAGEAEVSFVWNRQTGNRIQRCKGRTDWLCDAIVDLKTTRSVEASPFARDAAKLGYHMRAAFYQDGVKAVTGATLPVVLIAVEKSPPFDCAVYRVPDDALGVGRAEYQDLLDRLADCVEEDRWPGVVETEQHLEFPAWIFKEDPLPNMPAITMGGRPL